MRLRVGMLSVFKVEAREVCSKYEAKHSMLMERTRPPSAPDTESPRWSENRGKRVLWTRRQWRYSKSVCISLKSKEQEGEAQRSMSVEYAKHEYADSCDFLISRMHAKQDLYQKFVYTCNKDPALSVLFGVAYIYFFLWKSPQLRRWNSSFFLRSYHLNWPAARSAVCRYGGGRDSINWSAGHNRNKSCVLFSFEQRLSPKRSKPL